MQPPCMHYKLRIENGCIPNGDLTAEKFVKSDSALLWEVVPGAGTPLKKGWGCLSYLLGGEICELVPHRVLKPKMSTAGVVTVPLWVSKVIALKKK